MYFEVQDINKVLKEYRKKTDPLLNPLYGSHIFLSYEDTLPEKTAQEVLGQLLSDQVNVLAESDSLYAKMIRLYFLEKRKIASIAPDIGMSAAAYHRKRLDAVAELTTIINAYEENSEQSWSRQFVQRLEQPSAEKCFGTEHNIEEIVQLLTDKDRPSIINLQGMGGLGKTTLADAVIRRAITHKYFEDFGWVSARQPLTAEDTGSFPPVNMAISDLIELLGEQLLGRESLPVPFDIERTVQLLQIHMKEKPCLVVLDNLETLSNPEQLWTILNRLCNPTCFLMTSRHHVQVEYSIFPYIMPELDLDSSLALIRYRAEQTNLPHIAQASDEDLLPVYKTVGGNPLALLLVIGQMHTMDLEHTLNRLQAAQGYKIEEFYSYIYRQAWEQLDFNSRQVLLSSLLLPDDGETRDYFMAVSGVEPKDFHDALDKLVTLNLVSHHPGIGTTPSRYTIHSLTSTFLEGDEPTW